MTAPAMDCSEAQWQAWVCEQAEARGVATWHCTEARRSRPGLPDLLLLGSSLAVVELKAEVGRQRPEQLDQGVRWTLAGVPRYVLYPRHWREALALLDRLAVPGLAPAPAEPEVSTEPERRLDQLTPAESDGLATARQFGPVTEAAYWRELVRKRPELERSAR